MSSLDEVVLDPPDRRYSVFAFGGPATGKSTFLQQSPGPRLVLDTEGGGYDAGTEVVTWEFGGAMPDVDPGQDITVIRQIRQSAQMYETMRVLRRADHPFATAGLDSEHEMQDFLVREMQKPGEPWDPNAPMSEPAWGRVYNHMFDITKEFRNLSRPDGSSRPLHIVVTCASDEEETPRVPLTIPAIKKRLRYWFDIVGYSFEAEVDGKDVFVMQLTDNDLARAKVRPRSLRSQGIKQLLNPTLNDIIRIAQQGANHE